MPFGLDADVYYIADIERLTKVIKTARDWVDKQDHPLDVDLNELIDILDEVKEI